MKIILEEVMLKMLESSHSQVAKEASCVVDSSAMTSGIYSLIVPIFFPCEILPGCVCYFIMVRALLY